MQPLKVLVTNDDGADSPTLNPLLDCLISESWCSEVRPVIPAYEQSWVADAVTRFRPLKAEKRRMGPHTLTLVDGTPADCTQLGINNLFTDKADLVVSGINVGTNAGLPFFLSSGTVGGATAGFLAGIPAIAFSILTPPEVFHLWRMRDEAGLTNHKQTWKQLASLCIKVLRLLVKEKAWDHADIFSVNLPWESDDLTPIVLTELEHNRFTNLFAQMSENSFQHSLGDFSGKWLTKTTNSELAADYTAILSGKISVTPIRYNFSVSAESAQAMTKIMSRLK